MKRVIKQKMEDGSLQVVSQNITVPIAEWQALKKKVEEGTLYNSEEIITESGEWIAPVMGWYAVLLIGGGSGGVYYTVDKIASSGVSGARTRYLVWLQKGQAVSVVVGAGSPGAAAASGAAVPQISDTTFGELSANAETASRVLYPITNGNLTGVTRMGVSCSGPNGGTGYHPQSPNGHNAAFDGRFPGGGGGAGYDNTNTNNRQYNFGNGANGAVIVRWYDPDKP